MLVCKGTLQFTDDRTGEKFTLSSDELEFQHQKEDVGGRTKFHYLANWKTQNSNGDEIQFTWYAVENHRGALETYHKRFTGHITIESNIEIEAEYVTPFEECG